MSIRTRQTELSASLVLAALLTWGGLAPGALAQCQQEKLLASDMAQHDEFGWSVSISGTTTLIGAFVADAPEVNSGAAYVFEWSGSAWVETAKLTASDGEFGDAFGSTVSLSGDRGLVGARNSTVYVFQRRGPEWIETAKLKASDGGGPFFGACALAIEADTAVIGSDDQNGSGATYVFEWTGDRWIESAKLLPSDASFGQDFGVSVDLSGSTIVIGALGDDGATVNEGAAYVFEKQAGAWVEVAKLTASDAGQEDRFGNAVAVSGTTAFVGSFLDDDLGFASGSVYVFERSQAGSWGPNETLRLNASDAAVGDKFGSSLSLSGGRALIGARTSDDLGFSSGSAYLLERRGSGWTQVTKLLASDGDTGDLLGTSASLSGDLVLLGAHANDDACPDDGGCNSGSAYVFQLAETISPYCFGIGCPCGNDDTTRGCASSTGRGALLAACGSASATSDDLRLQGSSLPAHQTVIVFMGAAELSLPFGDGIRCVGSGAPGSLFRFVPPLTSDGRGRFTLGPGLASHSQASFPPPGQISAGETWNFQAWYRDPGGPCGSGFNLSNGVSVTYTP